MFCYNNPQQKEGFYMDNNKKLEALSVFIDSIKCLSKYEINGDTERAYRKLEHFCSCYFAYLRLCLAIDLDEDLDMNDYEFNFYNYVNEELRLYEIIDKYRYVFKWVCSPTFGFKEVIDGNQDDLNKKIIEMVNVDEIIKVLFDDFMRVFCKTRDNSNDEYRRGELSKTKFAYLFSDQSRYDKCFAYNFLGISYRRPKELVKDLLREYYSFFDDDDIKEFVREDMKTLVRLGVISNKLNIVVDDIFVANTSNAQKYEDFDKGNVNNENMYIFSEYVTKLLIDKVNSNTCKDYKSILLSKTYGDGFGSDLSDTLNIRYEAKSHVYESSGYFFSLSDNELATAYRLLRIGSKYKVCELLGKYDTTENLKKEKYERRYTLNIYDAYIREDNPSSLIMDIVGFKLSDSYTFKVKNKSKGPDSLENMDIEILGLDHPNYICKLKLELDPNDGYKKKLTCRLA